MRRTKNTSKVHLLREKYNLTQQQLADAYGIGKRTIEEWERLDRCPEYVYNLLSRAMAEDFPQDE